LGALLAGWVGAAAEVLVCRETVVGTIDDVTPSLARSLRLRNGLARARRSGASLLMQTASLERDGRDRARRVSTEEMATRPAAVISMRRAMAFTRGGPLRFAAAFAVLCSAQSLPLSRRLLADDARADRPTQVHLGLTGRASELLVQWATVGVPDAFTVQLSTRADLGDPVTVYGGAVRSYTALQFYDVDLLAKPQMDEVGAPISKGELCRDLAVPEFLGGLPPNCTAETRLTPQGGIVNNPDHMYSSPSLVSVLLQNLEANTQARR